MNGRAMYGTELMRILPYKGRLFASNTLWTESNPTIPKACQLLGLDSPAAKWKLLYQFPARNLRLTCLQNVTFTTDGSGKSITPVAMLLAAPDQVTAGDVLAYSLDDNTNTLAPMKLGATSATYSEIRAIGLHHDSVTGVDYVFAGSTALGIYRGVYNPSAPGRITWQASEYSLPLAASGSGSERVMGFANCNGVLHVATSTRVLRRTDGASPFWTVVKEYPTETPASGIRGLTAVPDPSGSGEVLLLTARGSDYQTRVRRLDPANGYAETIELNINADMGRRLNTAIPYVLSAYNDFFPYEVPGTGENAWMFGIEMTYTEAAVLQHPEWRVMKVEAGYVPNVSTNQYYAAEGRYYVRHVLGGVVSWELREVLDRTLPTLVSVRTIAASPFPADQGQVLYFGGYDANYEPSHSTAWIYRGTFGELVRPEPVISAVAGGASLRPGTAGVQR